MFATVISHAPLGIDGKLVSVEVDIRTGIPGIDIVGLPDGAVKEAKERVRVAIRNSGYEFPARRILVNLAPAGIRKAGASYDLPIAIGILAASGQIPPEGVRKTMVLGELNLSGNVRPVHGVLSAVHAGLGKGITGFLVPRGNLREARVAGTGRISGIDSLGEAAGVLSGSANIGSPDNHDDEPDGPDETMYDAAHYGDFEDIRGHWILKRALEVAAAGRHHLFLFGPPGSGKTMGARRLPSILPPLSREESLEVTGIHSIAGKLPPHCGLITRPPFRMPHHSASTEGIIGGGKLPKPGEVSLAHEGILFLDEAPEFRKDLLQALREPIEEERITIARAESNVRFPASFQLVLAANPCPCGNLGRKEKVCLCSTQEVYRYWKKLGGALLDRIDIRVPLSPVSSEELVGDGGPDGGEVRRRVEAAVSRQHERFKGHGFSRNSRIPPGYLDKFCPLDRLSRGLLIDSMKKISLSSRAIHSIIKIARTVSDLEGSERIGEEHILEAIQHRRYGDGDFFWKFG
ncbi:MAG: YifB family Mg chelatase-like AAA ATPase [Spirochaetales bacterium]|nr:YifB family Mg chelatase-like AAA ATPase [Spirochaetales bacterium]